MVEFEGEKGPQGTLFGRNATGGLVHYVVSKPTDSFEGRVDGIYGRFDSVKHTNDHMQSFYLKSPSGFWIEYGYGGREIGPDWEIRNYDAPMLWGHRLVGA